MKKYDSEVGWEEIANGKRDGERVWICDFRYNDLDDKPIRKVVAQEVLVVSNTKTKKRIYYSESHFVALTKKGEPSKSKVIPLVDNTGNRCRPGLPVRIFTTKEDCNLAFIDMCDDIRAKNERWIKNKESTYRDRDIELFHMRLAAGMDE